MKKAFSLFLAVILPTMSVLTILPAPVFGATEIFSDGFESPTNLGNWSSSGWMATTTASHTGSGSAAIIGGEGTQSISKVISTEGYENLTLSFWYKADSLDMSGDADKMKLFYILDGVINTEITSAEIDSDNDDNTWHQVTFSGFAPGANNDPDLLVKFIGDLNHPVNDSLWIDDFVLTGDPIETEETPVNTDYCANGTELTNAEFKKAQEDGLITLKVRVRGDGNFADLEVKNDTGCTAPLSLSSYKMFDTVNLNTQEFFNGTGLISATSSSLLTVSLPPCMAQVDAWYGLHPTTLDQSNPYGYPNIPWVLIYTHKYYENSGGEITTSGPVCQKGGGGEEDVEPFNVVVHKYLDGSKPVETSEASFSVSLSLGGSNFEGNLNSSNSFEYTLTNEQEHESLTVEEETGDEDDSLILPFGAECSEGKYRLAGYSWGTTLEEAEQKNESFFTTDSNLNLPDVSTDMSVIIWNESCPTEEEEPQNPDTNNDNGRGSESQSFSGGRHREISAISTVNGEVLGASTGPVCEPYLNDYLKFGNNNDPEEVKKLQIFLNQFFEVDNPVTGVFGPITFEMVKKFQEHQEAAVLTPWTIAGLPTGGSTGYVYKTTKRWINVLKCPESVIDNPIPNLP